MRILIDADACPVAAKDILYRVSERLEVPLVLFANAVMRIPKSKLIVLEVVAQGPTRPTTASSSGPNPTTWSSRPTFLWPPG